MIPEDQKNMTTQWWSTGRHFTAATQANKKQKTKQKMKKKGLHNIDTTLVHVFDIYNRRIDTRYNSKDI